MKDYLEKRRAELKKRGNKGFTLMEMLIVVAIIAVLIAIAIPIFTSQLENSREATDAANIRSAYAEVQAAALTGTVDSGSNVTISGNEGSKIITAEVTLDQQQDGWQNTSIKEIAGTPTSDASLSGVGANKKCTVTYTQATGKTTFAIS